MQEALDGFLSRKIAWRTDGLPTPVLLGFPGGSNPPAVQGMWIQYLFWEDPLEESMATHSSNLAWRIPWTGCLTGHLPWGHRVRHNWAAKHSTAFHYIHIPRLLYFFIWCFHILAVVNNAVINVGVSLVAQLVKNLPAMQETWVPSLVWEGKGYPLQYSGLYSPWGCKELDTPEQLSHKHRSACIFLNQSFNFFQLHTQEWNYWVIL